jgi:hypothetical protein
MSNKTAEIMVLSISSIASATETGYGYKNSI